MWLQGASWAGHKETPVRAPGTWEATGSTVLNEEVCVALERKDRERQTHVPSCTAGSRPDSWGDTPQGLQEGPGFLLGEPPGDRGGPLWLTPPGAASRQNLLEDRAPTLTLDGLLQGCSLSSRRLGEEGGARPLALVQSFLWSSRC